MPGENIDVVRHAFEAYMAGDADGALANFHPEVKIDFSARLDATVAQGHEALSELTTSWRDSFDHYTEEIDEIREIGDIVCVITTRRVRAKGSDFEITDRIGFLAEVNDGQITSLTTYRRPEEALEVAEKQRQG